VTTEPADLLGFGKRLGKVKPGFDADIVVWDSDPLSVGASPLQVWIDGTAQYENPVELKKPLSAPITPDLSLNTTNEETGQLDDVFFTGVSKVLLSNDDETTHADTPFNVAISNGKIVCLGTCETELKLASASEGKIIHLKNGYLTDSFTAFGSTLGLNAIQRLQPRGRRPRPRQ
jgi:hypothetical protein